MRHVVRVAVAALSCSVGVALVVELTGVGLLARGDRADVSRLVEPPRPSVIEPRTINVEDLPTSPQGRCPVGMVEVEGDYCPNVDEVCLRWVGIHGETVPAVGQSGRCAEFKRPSRCLGTKVHKRYCIDAYEWPNVVGERPKSWMSWYDAKRELEAAGKRLCTRSEWTMACEGTDVQPYPYGDGYHRDRTACNFDNPLPHGLDVFNAKRPNDPTARALDALLVKSGEMERCVSPWGVHDQIGNLDEWIVNETGKPYVSGLVSGHVFGVRNRCRAMTDSHGPTFSWYETGTRGCFSL